MITFQIAIDGPAGAGKSTIAQLIARELRIEYIDTGAMYRAITLKLLRCSCDLNDIGSIKSIMEHTIIDFKENNIFLDGENVNESIRMPDVNKKVSQVASIPLVRKKLVAIQRGIAKSKSVIMDGRDIGTNVLKDAEFKFYLTASVEERAVRRWEEMDKKGLEVSLDKIKQEINNRDTHDMQRKINPLKKAKDAIEVNSTGKSIEDVVKEILSYIKI
ncbi:MAG: (d)CMP kinase [Clostridia bacterium]|nr:(d)CMP kinase [Clostridia bacterium]